MFRARVTAVREPTRPSERSDMSASPTSGAVTGVTGVTGPGGPFEIVEELVLGERMPVFRHRPRSARELLVESARWGEIEYVIHGDERITFADHLERVAALAHVLGEEYGVGKG